MTEQKKHLTKSDRFKVMLRSQFLQGSWNYERMQNGGWAYSLIPALKKLYPQRDEASAAIHCGSNLRGNLGSGRRKS